MSNEHDKRLGQGQHEARGQAQQRDLPAPPPTQQAVQHAETNVAESHRGRVHEVDRSHDRPAHRGPERRADETARLGLD